MRKTLRVFFPVILVTAAFIWSTAFAREEGNKAKQKRESLFGAAGSPRWTLLNINNYTNWVRSDAPGALAPSADNQGIYPRGTGNVIYTDGFYYGSKAFKDAAKTQPMAPQPIRVGGKGYAYGLLAGRIIGTGASAVAQSPADAAVRIYRIRRDYAVMSESELKRDAAEINEIPIAQTSDAQMAAVTAQYDKDWKEWPVQYGAPYIDRNKNGRYDAPPAGTSPDDLITKNLDEPGVAGADPNSPADQVIWTVANDLDPGQSQQTAGSDPSGLEIQFTVWGYKRTDALGNLFFKRARVINKGGVVLGGGQKGAFYLDSMFVCNWSDIDLGNAGDDLAGCDTLLSMGFVYNGNAVDLTFRKFGLPPPASGYDFLQGPKVASPGDSAVFDLKRVKGFKNLPMTSFCYFSAGSSYSDPPYPGNYLEGAGRWWKMLRGYAPLGNFQTPDQYYATGPWPSTTKYLLSGDPVTKTGFIDGLSTTYSFPPGDRRILLTTGPFNLAPGDTQEIVVGVVAGLGSDRLSSIAVMKFNDRFVQNTYDALFQVPRPPKSPDVKVAELDGQIVLEWGSNISRLKDIEETISQPGAYRFEGYNVYQFPSRTARLSEAKRVVTFDTPNDPAVVLDEQFDQPSGQILKLPAQYGSNSGVERLFRFKRDYIRDFDKIYNYQEYYLAVTAYTVSTLPGYIPAALESPPIVLTVRPKVPFGVVLHSAFGDTIMAAHAGPSDGFAVAEVLDPSSVTGNTYQIRFDTAGTWRLTNATRNSVVFSGQTNQSADVLSPIADGMQWKVTGAPNDVKDLRHVRNPSGAISPATYVGFSTFNDWGFPDPSGQGAPVTDWGGGRWGIHTGGSAGDYSYEGRFKPRTFRGTNFSRFVPYDYEIRFTAAGGKAWLAFSSGAVINVPFELWNIGIGTPDNPSDDFRMIPWINDEDGSGVFQLMKIDHGLSGGDNDPYTSWIYWHEPSPKTPGSAGYNAFVAAGDAYDGSQGTGDEVMARMVLVNVNGGSTSDPTWPANANSRMPATGNVIRIISTKPNTPADVFTINTSSRGAEKTLDAQMLSAQKVGVFPNPYYAFNAAETNRFNRFVTFTNLPQKATIRIFNLAGQLVRTLRKDTDVQYHRWDLYTESGFPIASGMYIAHIDMPDLGTKVLKIAVIIEQEILDSY